MSVNKTITIGWKGEQHEVKVTMGVIDRIEEEINLMQFMQQVTRGDVRFTKVARLFSHLLRAAGVKVSQEEVYSGMFGGGDIQAADVMPVLLEVFSVMFPEPPKKPAATPKRKAKASKK